MARNKISDLNNHLFAELERLGDEDLKLDELNSEIERAKAISGIAKNLIDSNKTVLQAAELKFKFLEADRLPPDELLTQLPQ